MAAKKKSKKSKAKSKSKAKQSVPAKKTTSKKKSKRTRLDRIKDWFKYKKKQLKEYRTKRKAYKDKNPHYKSFKLQKRIKHDYYKDVPKVRILFKDTFALMGKNIKTLGGITLIYVISYVILVQGTAALDIAEFKEYVTEVLNQPGEGLTRSIVLVTAVMSAGTTTAGDAGAVYGYFLLLITGLAYVWALRNIYARKEFKIKDAYYRGMYPLIMVVLLSFVVMLQMIPAGLGNYIFSAANSNGLISTSLEMGLLITLWGLLILLSGYLFTTTMIAIYIVMLPNMTPMRALAAAKKLVMHRRWVVLRKILALFAVIFVFVILVVLLAVGIVPNRATTIMTMTTFLVLPIFHTYMYTLYRSLI